MHFTHYTIALVSNEVLLPVQQLNHMDKVTRFLEPHFLKLASGSFSPIDAIYINLNTSLITSTTCINYELLT